MLIENQVEVAAEIRSRVEDLDQVLARLHPWDCQTCGRRIGTAMCSLTVAAVETSTRREGLAMVHHRACRASSWGAAIDEPPPSASTYCTDLADFDVGYGVQPLVLLNPSAEVVQVRRASTGLWRPASASFLRQAGMRRASPSAPMAPATDVVASLASNSAGQPVVRIHVPTRAGGEVYDCPLVDQQAIDLINGWAGVWLLATALYNPADAEVAADPNAAVWAWINSRDALMEWIPLMS